MTIIDRCPHLASASLFEKLAEMFRSKTFIIFAANELAKAYCTIEGCPYNAIDEHQKEQIASCWASIPAADAVAHQVGTVATCANTH